ncbi:MAG: LysM peptidoglycan-binding domain-containing protein [Treponema sp.]|jgi:hypothetical protein|nr:LysM peptidoglycan-binding domain-containing protein [Treponema sp.]
MIGIKVADGAFFPIVEENVAARKRLVLTTANDAQTSVQIDFYRSSSASMSEAAYIGTLLIENITKKNKGNPSIELIISSDGKGEFSASAYDIDRPEEKDNHILSVSLPARDNSNNFYDIDLEHEDSTIQEDRIDRYGAAIKSSKSKLPLILILAGVLLLLLAFGLWFFILRSKPEQTETEIQISTEVTRQDPEPSGGQTGILPEEESMQIPPPEIESLPEPVVPPPEPVKQEEPPVIKAPSPPITTQETVSRKRAPAPVSSYNAPSVIPKEGISYKLRWGDTLWDVSQAFYRTPWRYDYLARYNGIRDPNRIVAGRAIRIPPLPK